MGRSYTPFQLALVKSIVWQVKGFQDHHVPSDATRRVLRASLRRVNAVHLGKSTGVTGGESVELDHVVPINVICDILINIADVSEESIKAILEKYLLTAELTKDEHRGRLKLYRSRMPNAWNADSEDPDNHFARYAAVGITIVDTRDNFVAEQDDEDELAPGGSSRERFPLRKFYEFAKENGLVDEAVDIKTTNPPSAGKRGSTIRRGRAIGLLEEEGKLDDFILESWEFGLCARGKAEIAKCKRFARRFGFGNA